MVFESLGLSLSLQRVFGVQIILSREKRHSPLMGERMSSTHKTLSLSLSLSLESTPLGEGTDARAQKKAGSAPAIIKAFPEKRNSL